MKNLPLSSPRAIALSALLLSAVAAHAARPLSDLLPSARRQTSVDLAAQLTTGREIKKVPDGSINPFSPPNFQAPDAEELRAAAEAAAASRRNTVAAAPARPSTDRELLKAIAPQIRANGTVMLGGEQILLIGPKKLRVGESFAVTFEGRSLSLTVTAIDRTTFTLRLNGEELTRPIKSGTNP